MTEHNDGLPAGGTTPEPVANKRRVVVTFSPSAPLVMPSSEKEWRDTSFTAAVSYHTMIQMARYLHERGYEDIRLLLITPDRATMLREDMKAFPELGTGLNEVCLAARNLQKEGITVAEVGVLYGEPQDEKTVSLTRSDLWQQLPTDVRPAVYKVDGMIGPLVKIESPVAPSAPVTTALTAPAPAAVPREIAVLNPLGLTMPEGVAGRTDVRLVSYTSPAAFEHRLREDNLAGAMVLAQDYDQLSNLSVSGTRLSLIGAFYTAADGKELDGVNELMVVMLNPRSDDLDKAKRRATSSHFQVAHASEFYYHDAASGLLHNVRSLSEPDWPAPVAAAPISIKLPGGRTAEVRLPDAAPLEALKLPSVDEVFGPAAPHKLAPGFELMVERDMRELAARPDEALELPAAFPNYNPPVSTIEARHLGAKGLMATAAAAAAAPAVRPMPAVAASAQPEVLVYNPFSLPLPEGDSRFAGAKLRSYVNADDFRLRLLDGKAPPPKAVLLIANNFMDATDRMNFNYSPFEDLVMAVDRERRSAGRFNGRTAVLLTKPNDGDESALRAFQREHLGSYLVAIDILKTEETPLMPKATPPIPVPAPPPVNLAPPPPPVAERHVMVHDNENLMDGLRTLPSAAFAGTATTMTAEVLDRYGQPIDCGQPAAGWRATQSLLVLSRDDTKWSVDGYGKRVSNPLGGYSFTRRNRVMQVIKRFVADTQNAVKKVDGIAFVEPNSREAQIMASAIEKLHPNMVVRALRWEGDSLAVVHEVDNRPKVAPAAPAPTQATAAAAPAPADAFAKLIVPSMPTNNRVFCLGVDAVVFKDVPDYACFAEEKPLNAAFREYADTGGYGRLLVSNDFGYARGRGSEFAAYNAAVRIIHQWRQWQMEPMEVAFVKGRGSPSCTKRPEELARLMHQQFRTLATAVYVLEDGKLEQTVVAHAESPSSGRAAYQPRYTPTKSGRPRWS